MNTATTAASAASVRMLSVSEIRTSPYQARKQFDEDSLKGLADSMKEVGQLQPILVRKAVSRQRSADSYELISGERRLRAAKLLGWKEIEAKIIESPDEAETAAKGLVENLQRQDLNPIEEAEGFKLLNQLDRKKWTQDNIGKISGRSRVYVTQSLGILELPDEVKAYVSRLTLSRSHALEIMRLPEKADQLKVARLIPAKLTREETRALVDQMVKGASSASPHRPTTPSPRPAMPPAGPDPLAPLWTDVQAEAASQGRAWGVEYGLQEIFGTGMKRKAWKFWVMNSETDPKTDVQNFVQDVAKAIGYKSKSTKQSVTEAIASAEVSKDEKAAMDAESRKVPGYLRATTQGIQQDEQGKRLPKTAQEQAELEALAPRGPHAVYTWIYGKDSFFAKQMAGKTWEEVGYANAIDGVREIVRMMKE